MKNINADIKNNSIKQFYLLCGDEDYLKNQFRNNLVNALCDKNDDMNYSVFEGKKAKVDDILSAAVTLPFFADNRVVVVENSGFMKKCPDGLPEGFENLPETTHIIFVEKETDGKTKLYKWFKSNDNAYISEMKTPDENELITWVSSKCQKEGFAIEKAAIYLLAEKVSLDMMTLSNELEKLFSYCCERKVIKAADVEEVCVTQAQDTLFKLLDAIGAKDKKKALLYYNDMLALRIEPIKILAMLSRQYRIYLEIKTMAQEDKSPDVMAKAAGIKPFLVGKYKKQVSAYTREQLFKMWSGIVDVEQAIKTGRIQARVGVETLIVEYSSRL